jgi:hypothetical protein
MSAPVSRRASIRGTSSLLAAQCNGVSRCHMPTAGAWRSAPASTSVRTIATGFGLCPGQSAKRCNAVRAAPLAFLTVQQASSGWAASSRRSPSTSPSSSAAVSSTAIGSSLRSVRELVIVGQSGKRVSRNSGGRAGPTGNSGQTRRICPSRSRPAHPSVGLGLAGTAPNRRSRTRSNRHVWAAGSCRSPCRYKRTGTRPPAWSPPLQWRNADR